MAGETAPPGVTAHKCSFPVQPPGGSILNPGPCRTCGKTWPRYQAERAQKQAQAAMEATGGA